MSHPRDTLDPDLVPDRGPKASCACPGARRPASPAR